MPHTLLVVFIALSAVTRRSTPSIYLVFPPCIVVAEQCGHHIRSARYKTLQLSSRKLMHKLFSRCQRIYTGTPTVRILSQAIALLSHRRDPHLLGSLPSLCHAATFSSVDRRAVHDGKVQLLTQRALTGILRQVEVEETVHRHKQLNTRGE